MIRCVSQTAHTFSKSSWKRSKVRELYIILYIQSMNSLLHHLATEKICGLRKLRNCTQKSSQTKKVGKNDHSVTLTESMTINETTSCRFSVPLDTPDIELPPAHQSTPMSTNKEQKDSVFVDDDPSHLSPSPSATDSYIFDSPSQSPHRKDTNKKSYHRLLQIHTPALEVKKRPPRRKPKVIKVSFNKLLYFSIMTTVVTVIVSQVDYKLSGDSSNK